jgi:GT2 family glycosyltransferase
MEGDEIRKPAVTVSLVVFNGMRWLPGCLESLVAQTENAFDLVVLDNASDDGSQQWLRDFALREPRMRLTESTTNLGFAAGHNRNIEAVRTEFVMLLNQDIELDTDFLAQALAAFGDGPRVGAVQGRLLRLSAPGERTQTIDSTGLVMHRDRRVVARGQGELTDAADLVAEDVWGVDGPAPVYRRAALSEAREPRTGGGWEVLDEDFFMYKEDVDLAWRLQRLGWTTRYQPAAVAWHARGADGGPARSVIDVVRAGRRIPRWIKDISWRNHRLMQIKNEDADQLLRDLPWILRREVLSLGFMALTDPRRLTVLADLIRLAPRAAAKRRRLTRRRRDPDL